jgi:hypothetical protein
MKNKLFELIIQNNINSMDFELPEEFNYNDIIDFIEHSVTIIFLISFFI